MIRLCIMPFAAHSDLLFMVQESHNIAYHGVVAPNTYYFVNFGIMPTDTTLHYYLVAAWLWLIRPLVPSLDALMSVPPSSVHVPMSPYFLSQLVSDPFLFRTLFLVKVPYLFFDLATGFLLLKTVYYRSSLIFKFWMVNPIVIYVSYVFGGYDIFPAFFALLAIYFAQQNKHTSSYLTLGIAGALKLYAFLLLPVFLLAFPASTLGRIKLALVSVLPYVISILPDVISSGPTLLPFNAFSSYQSEYILNWQVKLGSFDTLYVFVLLFSFLLLFQYYSRINVLGNLWRFAFAVLMLYFATSEFHPQYFLWVLPFLGVAICYDTRYLRLHILQILCYIVYTFYWGKPFAGMMFFPLGMFFTYLTSPIELMSMYFSAPLLIGVVRSVFSAICLWMIYLTFRTAHIDNLHSLS